MPESIPDVYLMLGSNIDPERNLQRGLDRLREVCTVLAVSEVYESPAFELDDLADFLNVAVKCATAMEPAAFKTQVLEPIEIALGRDRDSPLSTVSARPLDIDIVLWGEQAFTYGDKPWRVPDKDILKQAAVAVPLAEVAGELVHPEASITIQKIADGLDQTSIRPRMDLQIR